MSTFVYFFCLSAHPVPGHKFELTRMVRDIEMTVPSQTKDVDLFPAPLY